MGLCRRVFTEMYAMLKKGEYHNCREAKNHEKKMAEYRAFLESKGLLPTKILPNAA